MTAIWEKALSLDGIVSAPDLIRAFIGRVQTDLSIEQLTMLACVGRNLTKENIHYGTIPRSLLYETNIYSEQLGGYTYALKGDPQEIGDYIRAFFLDPEIEIEDN